MVRVIVQIQTTLFSMIAEASKKVSTLVCSLGSALDLEPDHQ